MVTELRFKKLICALVAMAVVLSPWGSDVLPEPLDRLGAEPALAQPPPPPVVDGTPVPCRASMPDEPQWAFYGDPPDPQSPLCWVESYLPCPQSPLSAGGQMSLVDHRADLCEVVATDADYPAVVGDCLRVNADGHQVDEDGEPVPKLDPNGVQELDDDDQPIPKVFDPDDYHGPAGYAGFVNHYEYAGGAPTCRLLAPSGCPTGDGLYRISRTACRGYMRRTWECPSSHPIALNQFNRCYGEPAIDISSGHPACAQRPPVAVVDCEEYVGTDFVANPDANACEEFDRRYNEAHPATWPPFDTFEPAANAHWCAYGVIHLHPKCERGNASDPDCDPQRTAVCIMRSSGIGGCDGVAHRMICSDLQAAYANASGQSSPDQLAVERTLRRLRENDCKPCVLLPFGDASACDPPVPSPTPTPSAIGKRPESVGNVRVDAVNFQLFAFDRTKYPQISYRRYYHVDDSAIFARFARMSYTGGRGFAVECHRWRELMVEDMKKGLRPDYSELVSDECKQILCSSPTVGRVAWASEHISGLALVGTPIIATIDEIPLRTQTVRVLDRRTPGGAGIRTGGQGLFPNVDTGEELKFAVRYDPDTGDEPLLFTREELARAEPSHNIDDFYSNRVECSLRDSNAARQFSLVITELWPDTDADKIEGLFGTDALAWWNTLTDIDKSRATEARGYVYIDDSVLTPEEITDERSRRTWGRTEEIPCEFRVPGVQNPSALRCRWTPRRAGYYSVQAAGVWPLNVHDVGSTRPRLLRPDERGSWNRLLEYDGSTPDTDGTGPNDDCPHGPGDLLKRNQDRDCLKEDLEWALPFGFDPPEIPPGMSPEQEQDLREEIKRIQRIQTEVRAQVFGLKPDFSGLLDRGVETPPDSWGRNCLIMRDFRYTCHPYDPDGFGIRRAASRIRWTGASYTTSEPVGVVVHGAQVVSRRPAGSR